MKIEIIKKKDIVVIKIPKYFFIGNIVEVEEIWNQILTEAPKTVGFDFQQVEFIDSSAIGTLVKFYNISVKNNFEMHIFSLGNDIRKIFETTKIDRVMSVLGKEEFESLYS